jgi:hypothetical protein
MEIRIKIKIKIRKTPSHKMKCILGAFPSTFEFDAGANISYTHPAYYSCKYKHRLL